MLFYSKFRRKQLKSKEQFKMSTLTLEAEEASELKSENSSSFAILVPILCNTCKLVRLWWASVRSKIENAKQYIVNNRNRKLNLDLYWLNVEIILLINELSLSFLQFIVLHWIGSRIGWHLLWRWWNVIIIKPRKKRN